MTSFGIFVIVLTFAYIIYYGILISQEIIAAKKNGGKSNTETFSFDEFDSTEDSKMIVETEEGQFAIESAQPIEKIPEAEQTEQPKDDISSTQEATQSVNTTNAPTADKAPVKPETDKNPYNSSSPENIQKINETRNKMTTVEDRHSETSFLSDNIIEMFEELNNAEISKRICIQELSQNAA